MKVNIKNFTKRCKMCSKLTINTVVHVSLLLIWTYLTDFPTVSINDFENIFICWVLLHTYKVISK